AAVRIMRTARAQYIAPVGISVEPRRSASTRATVLSPAPAGPSIVITGFFRDISAGPSPHLLPRGLDPREHGPQRVGLAGVDGPLEIGERLTKGLDGGRQGVSVRQEDLRPHIRVARGDARGVPEPARGELERGRLDAGGAVDQGARDQVRQVA